MPPPPPGGNSYTGHKPNLVGQTYDRWMIQNSWNLSTLYSKAGQASRLRGQSSWYRWKISSQRYTNVHCNKQQPYLAGLKFMRFKFSKQSKLNFIKFTMSQKFGSLSRLVLYKIQWIMFRSWTNKLTRQKKIRCPNLYFHSEEFKLHFHYKWMPVLTKLRLFFR